MINFSDILKASVRKSAAKASKGLTGLDCLPKTKPEGFASILKGSGSPMVKAGADTRINAAFNTPSAYAARMGNRIW